LSTSKLSLTFRIYKGDQLIREERLAQGVIKVGKVPSAHLRIDDESVSRMHAIVEASGAGVTITDLGSTRGTFVNGQRVHKAALRTGDSILIGDSRVEIAIAEPALEAPAIEVIEVLEAAAAPAPARAAPPALPPAPPAPRTAAPATALGTAGGAKAVEVAAMLGDSVVGVKHCMNPRGGKVTRATWGLAAGGLACLLASAGAFYASVDTAATNAAALARHTHQLHKPAYSFRPRELGRGVDGVAFGGLALGLGLATLALVRARNERRSPFYRIGTAPGVEQPVEHAPSESFPLVAPSGDDFVFNYGPGIDGELIADGAATPLAELAAAGRGRPSTAVPGAIELPIPAAAKIRARAGQTTFLVSAVDRPASQATTAFAGAFEGRTLKYVAGSLATHLGLVLLLSQVDVAEAGASVNLMNREALGTLTKLTANETPPPPEPEQGDPGDGAADAAQETTGMELPSGTAGDPKAQQAAGKLQIKDNNVAPQLSREHEIELARSAGILGSTRLHDDISQLTSNLNFSSGFDPENTLGPIDGSSAGVGRGTFGMGVTGDGRGGGCFIPPCGIVGTGKIYTGTIGTGKFAGDGYRIGVGGNGGMRTHVAAAPIYTYPVGIPEGTLDKSIVKRYIKQREEQIGYCYQKELLARPKLAGTVTIQFLISPTGNVQSSVGAGFDQPVASCVADVIKAISFPAPKNGGAVTVNYPFTFRTAGGA
jgi:hypothetical protein